MLRKLLMIACLSSIVFAGYAQKNKKKTKDPAATEDKTDYRLTGSPLPGLKFFSREGKYITNKDLLGDGNLILMLFNPTCDHCEEQAGIFKDNIFLFDKTKLMLVAGPIMVPHLEYFTHNTQIKDYPTIQMGVDSSNYIEKVFLYKTLPQINVYDKDRKLVRIFSGVTPIDTLKQYIN